MNPWIKRIIGIALLVASFVPLPSPLDDINAKISLILSGISFLGHEIFFVKRNIITLIIFFCSVSTIAPIDLPLRIILFIISLDLITFPIIPSIPFVDMFVNVSKIVGRAFLIITLFGLNVLGLGKLGIDANMIIIFVVLLTAGEIALNFVAFGIIPWKAIIIFVIGLIWVFNWNWMLALIPAAAEFILDRVL